MKCSECRWFKRDSDSESVYGLCKRYPPTIIKEECTESPYVYENDFCGEFVTPEKHREIQEAFVQARDVNKRVSDHLYKQGVRDEQS